MSQAQDLESARVPIPDNKGKIEKPQLSITEVLISAEALILTESILQENRIEYTIHGYSEQKVKDDGSDYGKERETLGSSLFIVRVIRVKGKDFVGVEEMSEVKKLLEKEGVILYSQDLWNEIDERAEKVESPKTKG